MLLKKAILGLTYKNSKNHDFVMLFSGIFQVEGLYWKKIKLKNSKKA